MPEARQAPPIAAGPGTRLAGRYLLLDEIGRGGMARVFRARDLDLDREVAIKLPHDSPESNETWSVAEARTAAGVVHPGIAAVYDVGSYAGSPYIVMELVPGGTLRDLLAERGRLSQPEALRIALALTDALAALHERGLSHCDVKPRNVVVTPDGQPKLVDFGIARGSAISFSSPEREVWGSVAYAAPEQVQGLPPGPRSDVYALGAVLYEMLTGRPPFVGGDSQDVLAQRLHADPAPPRTLEPSVSPRVEHLVLTALARDPRQRYTDAAAFGGALRAAVHDRASPPAASTAWTAPLSPRGAAARPEPRPSILRTRLVPVSRWLAPALAALLLAGGLLALQGRASRPPSPAPRAVVPSLLGQRLADAPAILGRAGLALDPVAVRTVDRSKAGTIVDQDPPPGAEAAPGGRVRLTVGTAP